MLDPLEDVSGTASTFAARGCRRRHMRSNPARSHRQLSQGAAPSHPTGPPWGRSIMDELAIPPHPSAITKEALHIAASVH